MAKAKLSQRIRHGRATRFSTRNRAMSMLPPIGSIRITSAPNGARVIPPSGYEGGDFHDPDVAQWSSHPLGSPYVSCQPDPGRICYAGICQSLAGTAPMLLMSWARQGILTDIRSRDRVSRLLRRNRHPKMTHPLRIRNVTIRTCVPLHRSPRRTGDFTRRLGQ
jgi:hypothetical protein